MTTLQQKLEDTSLEEEKRVRLAFRLLFSLGLIITLAGSLVIFRLVINGEIGPDLMEPGAGVIAGIFCLFAAMLARRHHLTAAIGLATVALFGMDSFLIYRLSDIGLPLTIILTIALILIASQTLSPHQVVKSILLIFSMGASLIVLDLYWPFERGNIASADLQIIYIASLLVIGIGLFVTVRQFPKFSLRTKLISMTIVLVSITILLTTVLATTFARRTLTNQLNKEFASVSESQAFAVSELLGRQVSVLEALRLDRFLRNILRSSGRNYDGNQTEILAQILEQNEEWAADPETSGLANSRFNNVGASVLRTFQSAFPVYADLMVLDEYGALVSSTHLAPKMYFGDEQWFLGSYAFGIGAVHIGTPQISPLSGEIGIPMAVPIFNTSTGLIDGVLYATYRLDELADLLGNPNIIGSTAHKDILFENLTIHFEEDEYNLEPIELDTETLTLLRQENQQNIITEIEGRESLINLATLTTFNHIPAIDALDWAVLVHQPEAEAFAPVEILQRIAILLGLAALVISSGLAAYLSNFLTKPINRLTDTAVVIAGGDLHRRVSIETEDEIGTLAAAFNNMTAQLRDFIGTLEERVANRTKDLATSSEVSRQLSTILDQEELVNEVVTQIRDSFNYYHAQIYLYDEEKEYLHMVGGTGKVGHDMLSAGHKLGTNQGIVGRAAATNEIILISDVAKNSAWLANEMLPDTKSEVAIPISLGDDVLGVLDVQHNISDGLDQSSAQLLQSIANQVAIALQNARQVTQTKEALAESDRLYKLSEEQARRLAQLNEMSAALNAANSEEEIYQILGKRMSSILDEGYASLAFMEPDDEMIDVVVLNPEEAVVNEENGNRFQVPAENTIVAQVVRNDRFLCLPQDGSFADFSDTQRIEKEGFQSTLVAPLKVGNKWLGAFNIVSNSTATFTDTYINFIRQLASILATILENQRVNQRANLLASIVENHPDFIGVGSLEGQAMYVNPSGLQMMGLSTDADVSGMDTSSFYSAKDAELLANEGIPAAMESGAWSAEANLLTTDGSTIPVEETIGINYDTNNEPTSFSITMRDIRERKLAEDTIRKSEQLALDFQEKLTRLHEISAELSQLEDVDDIYRRAIELGREKLEIDRLGLFLFDESSEYIMGTFGTNAEGEIQLETHIKMSLAEHPWISSVIENRERRIVRLDTDLYDNEEVVGRGWNILSTLFHEEKAIGFIAVDNLIEQRPLLPYEPELFTLFAATLANIILNKRSAQELSKQAQELQAVAEVSRIATTILDREALLQQVCDLTKEKFGLYHVHIYSLSQDKQSLQLAAGAGEIGRQMVTKEQKVPVRKKQSLVARAARSREGVIVNDVRSEPGFLANPLLPETRAELATPLIAGEELLGVLDIQSDKTHDFNENDINIQTTLAAQIANAIQNANQYQRAQAALDELTRMQQMLIREGWESFLTAKDQKLQGYRYDQQDLQPIERNGTAVTDKVTGEKSADDTAVYSPLTVRGATIGTLGVRDPSGQPVPADKQHLLTSISQQVAEALERARLFEETELARTETEIALDEVRTLLEVSAQLNAATTFTEIIEAACAPAIAAGASSGGLYKFEFNEGSAPEWAELVAVAGEKQLPVGTRLHLPELPFAEQWLTGNETILFIENVAESEVLDPAFKAVLEQTNTKAGLFVTLFVGNRIIGNISIRWPEPREFTETDKRLYTSIAVQTASVVDSVFLLDEVQERATELQETTGFLDSVIENLPVMLFVKDADDLSFIRWNKAGSDITGYPQETFIGKTDYDFFPKEEADFFVAKDREVLEAGEIVEIPDEPLQTAHQGTRILHTRKVPIHDADGNPKYLLGISEDITERRQTEMIMAKRAMELQTVSEISTSVGATLDAEELLNEVVNLTWTKFGLYHVNLYLLNETKKELELAAGSGTVGADMVAEGHTISLDSKKSLVAQAARTREGIIVNDVEKEEGHLPNPLLPLTCSEMAVPMLAGNKVVGVLDVQSEEGDHFSSQDVNIQTTLASQIATALENARLFTQTEKRATELATINAINTVASEELRSMRSLLERIGEQLHKTFNSQSTYIAFYDEDNDTISFPYFYDKNDGPINMNPRSVAGGDGGFTAQIIETRQPLIMSTVSKGDAQAKGAQVAGTGRMTDSYLGVPLIIGDRLLGVIGMSAYKEMRVYTEEDQALLMTLARTIGVALQNVQQFEATQRRAERERLVNDITQKIQSALSVENALQTAVKELGSALNAKNAQVELDLGQTPPDKSNGSTKKAG